MAVDLTGMWPNASRGLPQPGMMYSQMLTPVNWNDPVEVARWQAKYGTVAPKAPAAPLPAAPTSGADLSALRTLQSPTIPMAKNSQGIWEPTGADLSGLTPYRQASQRVLGESFQPRGGVPQQDLEDLINRQLWGTGESAGVYSQMARRGLSELQPETQYATSRTVRDAIQDLANQYQTRQRAAIESGRTTEMIEPNFRLTEAGVTGTYGGAPTMAREQMDIDKMLREAGLTGTYQGVPTLASKQLSQQESQFARALAAKEELSRLDRELQTELMKGNNASRERIAQLQNEIARAELDFKQNALIGGGIGSILERSGLMDWLFGSQGGRGGGGVTGQVTQGVVNKAGQAAWDYLFGGGAAPAASWPTFSSLGLEAPALGPLSEADMVFDAAGNLVPLASSAPAAGVAAGVGPAAPSIEAGLVEMLGPELAAQLGYTAPVVAAPAAAAVGAGAGAAGGAFAGGAAGASAGYPMAAGASTSLGLAGAAGPIGLAAAPIIMGLITLLSPFPKRSEPYQQTIKSRLDTTPGGWETLAAEFQNPAMIEQAKQVIYQGAAWPQSEAVASNKALFFGNSLLNIYPALKRFHPELLPAETRQAWDVFYQIQSPPDIEMMNRYAATMPGYPSQTYGRDWLSAGLADPALIAKMLQHAETARYQANAP